MPKPIPLAFFKDRQSFYYFIRQYYVKHPFYILVMSCTLFFKMIGMIVPEFHSISRISDVAFLALRLLAFVGLFIWIFPEILYRLLPRNIPFVFIEQGFFLICCIPSALILFPFHQETIGNALLRFAGQQCYATVLTYTLMFFFERSIREHLGNRPEYVPVFWPVKVPDPVVAEAVYLADDLKGLILVMQAQNQYVQVTTTVEQRLLRLTLGQAIDALPQSAGLRLHRSWWVSRAHLETMAFNAKNTELIGQDMVIPVSKSAYDAVATVIAEARPLTTA